MVKVSVHWGAKVFKDVDVLVELPPSVLRSQLWSLTGVLPERQKLMVQGKGLLRDDLPDLTSLNIKQGSKLMLVGTAEGKELKAPTEKPRFVEDMSAIEKAKFFDEKKIEVYPSGLVNLGTTCYLNSIIQFLRPVKQFGELVKRLPGNLDNPAADIALCGAFRELYIEMDRTIEAVRPFLVVAKLRIAFPQFARRSTAGAGYMQQDAEECLSLILETFHQHGISTSTDGRSTVDELFQFELETKYKCLESEDEPEEVKCEKARLLSCHLGTQLNPVDHMHVGVKLSLQGTIEKLCGSLDRNANWMKTSRMASLPKNLIVQFVRFEWKAANALARTEATRTKIVRKVNFSRRMDMYEFCSESLQAELMPGRDVLNKRSENEAAARNAPVDLDASTEGEKEGNDAEGGGDVEMTPAAADGEEAIDLEKPDDAITLRDDNNALPMDTGHYDLATIVTHQGRTAESGHYIAWVCHNGDTWLKMDDEKVTPTQWKDIDVSGGRSDYHVAIMLLYVKSQVTATAVELHEAKAEAEARSKLLTNDADSSSSSGGGASGPPGGLSL